MIDPSEYTIAEMEALRETITQWLATAWAAESAQERAVQEQERHVEEMGRIAAGYHAAHGGIGTSESPREWEPVTAPHMAWPRDSWVTWDDAVWHNPDHPANVWEPGTVGSPWVRQDTPDPDTGHIAWAVGQDVKTGNERTHDGRLWRAKVDHITHVGWEPSPAAYNIWTDLGPLEDS